MSNLHLMDPKRRLSSQIHFLVPLGITYSDTILCGNALENMDHVYQDLINFDQYETYHNCFTFGNFLYWASCISSSICRS